MAVLKVALRAVLREVGDGALAESVVTTSIKKLTITNI
jgi:hypothetical protein